MNYATAERHAINILSHELADTLRYHGLHHTIDVLAITEELCTLEGINEYDTTLLKTAALLHDIGFTIGHDDHEAKSCTIAKQLLPLHQYTEGEINQICDMIMATKIPQTPTSQLAEILCDADLDYLGRADFEPIAETLFQELAALNIVKNLETWNLIQISFIEKHRYFTKTNQQRREHIKQQHLAALRLLVP